MTDNPTPTITATARGHAWKLFLATEKDPAGMAAAQARAEQADARMTSLTLALVELVGWALDAGDLADLADRVRTEGATS